MRQAAALLLLAACPLLAALTGCSTSPDRETTAASGAQTAGSLSVRGFPDYDGNVTVPQDSFAIVELRDTEPPRAVVAEQHIELAGRSLPVQFALVVEHSKLASDSTYAVRGAVKQGAKALWATDPVVIDAHSTSTIDLGMQVVKPVIVAAFASTWNCGGQRVVIGMAGDLLRVVVGDEYFDMRPVVAASGMRYEALGDPTTTLWSLDRRASLTVRGKALQECVWVSSPK